MNAEIPCLSDVTTQKEIYSIAHDYYSKYTAGLLLDGPYHDPKGLDRVKSYLSPKTVQQASELLDISEENLGPMLLFMQEDHRVLDVGDGSNSGSDGHSDKGDFGRICNRRMGYYSSSGHPPRHRHQ